MSAPETKAASGAKTTHLLRVRNAAQIVCVCSSRQKFKSGKDMDKVDIIENATMIIGHDGLIAAIGADAELSKQFADATFETDIDATGKAIIPGLVDAHTHPVWSGDRVHEFKAKLAGATYMDIHKMGGGIGFTVRHTHASSEEELQKLFVARLNRMLKLGTTLIEAKSGYGLDLKNEVKMLKVIHATSKVHPVEIVANYCGAHSVPKESNAAAATKDVIENQIPEIAKLKKEGVINPELIDVFCEKGVFETEDSRKILQAGKAAGLAINFHGDELNPTKSAEMGADIGATAISHLECISEEGIASMAKNQVVGVLLPSTAYVLRIHPPPARKLIDSNVPVALGSDYNPNAHCMSMPFVMNLAAVMMRMTLNETLVAATINSAASMNRSATHGSLEVGKVGDFVLIGASAWEHIVYELVDPPVLAVVKRGKVAWKASES